MIIKKDDLSSTEVIALIESHVKEMLEHSPEESMHALNLEQLKTEDITFWTIWDGNSLAGCGAIKELDEQHGEIKSMRTTSEHIRKGVAQQLLQYIITEAQIRGYKRISLETGSLELFIPARRLYEKFGFQYCEPFDEYEEDPYSVFMTKEL